MNVYDMNTIKENYINELCKRLNANSIEELLPGQDIRKLVDYSYNEKNIEFYNSYTCERHTSPASNFISLTEDLIVVENGTYFRHAKTQEEVPPCVETEIWYGVARDDKKDQMKYYSNAEKGNDPIKAKYYNAAQNDCKTKMNTFYGLLQIASPFYNPDMASSITCRGRSTISVCALTVESILGGYWTNNIDAILYSIDVVKAEVFSGMYDGILSNMNGDYPIEHFIKSLPTQLHKYRDLLHDKLKDYPKVVNILGIKNNVHNFFYLKEVGDIIKAIINKSTSTNKPFTNPYKKGDITEELNQLCELSKALMGFYWYQGTDDYDNVQQIIKGRMRSNIVLIDTDSNMISLTSMNEVIYNIYGSLFEGSNFSERDIKFTISNIATVVIDYLIAYSLERYKVFVNIPEEYRERIAMKNEYYYSQFSLTENKKNYAALMDIKEGVAFAKSKLDVKGLMFIKSVVNEKIGDIVSDIVENDILRVDKIALPDVLHKIRTSAQYITDILKSDDSSDFYATQKLNKPLLGFLSSEARCKSVEIYNVLGISEKIVPPSRFYTVKIDYEKDEFKSKYFSVYVKAKIYEVIHLIHKNVAKISRYYRNSEEVKNATYTKYESEMLAKIKEMNVASGESLQMGGEAVNISTNMSRAINKAISDMTDVLYNTVTTNLMAVENLSIFTDGYDGIDKPTALSRDNMYFALASLYEGGDEVLLDKLIEIHSSIMNVLKNAKDECKRKYNDSEINKSLIKAINGKLKFDNKADVIERIALPESIVENLPEIVIDLIDVSSYVTQIDNLLAPVVANLKVSILRNDSNMQLITNVLNYY